MGKFTSGVAMTDVGAMMRAIEAMHECHVEFIVRTHTRQAGGSISIECVAEFDRVPGTELPKLVAVKHTWPTKAANTFDGLLYNLLWQLDYAIQQAYEQLPLEQK